MRGQKEDLFPLASLGTPQRMDLLDVQSEFPFCLSTIESLGGLAQIGHMRISADADLGSGQLAWRAGFQWVLGLLAHLRLFVRKARKMELHTTHPVPSKSGIGLRMGVPSFDAKIWLPKERAPWYLALRHSDRKRFPFGFQLLLALP